MLGKTHLLLGVLLIIILENVLNEIPRDSFIILSIFILIGSILPDIDEKRSLLGRYLKPLNALFKHRGFFHSLYFILLLFLISLLLNKYIAFGLLIGTASHLILDATTKEGIYFPLIKQKIKGPIKVGSLSEKFFEIMLLASIIILLIR